MSNDSLMRMAAFYSFDQPDFVRWLCIGSLNVPLHVWFTGSVQYSAFVHLCKLQMVPLLLGDCFTMSKRNNK